MNRAAGYTSNTVPWEILRAAGYVPRLLDADDGATPHADRFMEPVFDRRIRILFDRLCSGAWSELSVVVISRASEQEHKLYLYLREVARNLAVNSLPELYLYNLLHTRTPEAYGYGLERTRQMVLDFGVTESALCAAIKERNQARGAVREIQGNRDAGMLDGSVAFERIAAFYRENGLVGADSTEASQRPRILIKGAPLETNALHRVMEAAGGYVVAEDDWRGSRAGGDRDVRTDVDPVTAVFEKYFSDEVGPRVQSAAERDAWIHRKVNSGIVDAVLFYLPLEDDVAGWDYPRQATWLEERKVPSMVMREIAPSVELDAFVCGVAVR